MKISSALITLGCLLSIATAQAGVETSRPQTAPTAARAFLERMSQMERKNSCISVEFESSDSAALSHGREVVRLWNGGQYDEALVHLSYLEARIGHVAIGNSWRTPVPTVETRLWGRDVRIGPRDSLAELALEKDSSSGHLFVVLRSGGGIPHFSVCMSTDTGATWAETFNWSGSLPTSLDAAVLSHRLYVAYNSPGENPGEIRLRRFRCADGMSDTFSGFRTWVAPCTLGVGDTMTEVALVSTGWLYLTAHVSDGSIVASYDDPSATSWTRLPTGITSNVSNGLGATANEGGDSTSCFFSYYDTSDTLRIYGLAVGSCRRRFSKFSGRGFPTSIAALHDAVICAYDDKTVSPEQVGYAVSFDDGAAWSTGSLGDGAAAVEAPGVALQVGAMAAVFRYCSPTRELRFRQRTDAGLWSDPVSIADHEPYWSRPAIGYLRSSVTGIAYLCNTSPVVRGAYFDRSDWVYGVAEQHQPQASSRKPGATVVRGVVFLSGPGTRSELPGDNSAMSRAILLDAAGRKVTDLKPGANDVSRLAPGVYFVRSTIGDQQSAITKVMITR